MHVAASSAAPEESRADGAAVGSQVWTPELWDLDPGMPLLAVDETGH